MHSMTFTEHPRLLARIAGVFYVIITAFAVYAYLCVRGRLIISIAPQRSSRELLQRHKRTLSRHDPCRSTASLV